MPGNGNWFDNHPRWSDTLFEVFGIVLGLIFISSLLYCYSNMSPKDRDEFIIMMNNFALEQYD